MKFPQGYLWHGDCLEQMDRIPNGRVSMIFADLPYGTTACAWDTIIPFEKLWPQLARVCRPAAPMLFSASQPFTTKLISSNMDQFKHDWIWDKNNSAGFVNCNHKPMTTCESILVFCDGTPTYNPQLVRRGKAVSKKGSTASACYGDFDPSKSNAKNNIYYPKMLIQRFPKTNGHKYNHHPTEKPVGLLEYLIKTYSNPGDLILDPTVGSGTTAIAAIKTGRRFIGIEKDPKIFQGAAKRITEFLRFGRGFQIVH